MSALDLEGGVQYPMGGFGQVIDSIADLARAEGVRIVTNAPAREIVVVDGAVSAVEYLSGGKRIEFADADIVVSAADLHHTETELLSAQHQSYPQKYWDARTPGPGALLLMLGVKGNCPSSSITRCCSRRTGRRGSTPSSARSRRCRTPRRSTCPSRAVWIRMPLPKVTRTSSCWCRSPPTRPWVAAKSVATAIRDSRSLPTG